MLFNSWPFVALVLITSMVYYALARSETRQIFTLILASLVFYGYGQPTLLLLLIASIAINAITSYELEKATSLNVRRIWASAGVCANLAILAAFKYGGLLATTVLASPSQAGGIGAWLMQLPLPIGISFYTFQGISLVIDTFSGDFEARSRKTTRQQHFRDTFFFISFFPQLVAGPVLKARQFIPQIGRKTWADINKSAVFHCLTTGYFLKMVIADNLNDQTFWIQYPYFQNLGSVDLAVLLVAFSAQIFADFAGYSLIAIGVAALFGYQLPRNFNFPYISRSIAEFWRRWHISLSSWLKEYLYFPLGGNRKGNIRTYVNLIIVMFLGGLWHGAAWSFAVWGLWHGIGLAIERGAGKYFGAAADSDSVNSSLPSVRLLAVGRQLLSGLCVFVFVTLGWLLFELTDIRQAFQYLESMLTQFDTGPSMLRLIICALLVSAVVIYHALYVVSLKRKDTVTKLAPWLYSFMIYMIIVNSGNSQAFVYFQF